MDELMLARLLERAAATTTYPATPMLRGRVMAALSATGAAPGRATRPAFVLGALAIVALAVVAAALAVPSSRSAIAELFGIEGSRIERLPTPAPGVTPTPLPTPGDLTSIATRVSLDEAERRAGFRPALPRDAGEPDGVYVKTYREGETVAIVSYAAFDVWEMRPRAVFFGKGLPDGVIAVDTTVGGRPARWIEGGPHIARLFDESDTIPGSERTVARDTLIWRTDFALYRMETTLQLADAIRVAETLP